MKIRFDHPATVRVEFQAGDELSVAVPSTAVLAAISSTRLDGAKVAHVVPDSDEDAARDTSGDERAVIGRRRARSERPEAVSR